jgi:hypothetical protein
VAGHQFILARRDVEARRLVVQRQANGVQQGGFARAGRAGNGEQAVAGERLGGLTAG